MKSSSVTCTAVAVTKPRMTELLADLRVTQLVAEPSCQLLKLHLLPLLTSGSSMVYTGSRLVKPHRIFILFLLDLQKFHIPKNKNPPVILAGANVCSAPENVYFQGRQSVSNCIQTKPWSWNHFAHCSLLLYNYFFSPCPGLSQGFAI